MKRLALVLSGSVLFIFLYEYIGRSEMNKVSKIVTEKPQVSQVYKTSEMEREEFVSRIKGMSTEEMEIVADLIPIDICMKRIEKELEKAKLFKDAIKEATKILD